MFLKVAGYSLLYRKFSVLLTVLSVTLSTFVLLGIEHIRTEARESFGNTVSGVDLIVGARTGQLNLLLYSVFHIGHATNNISWASYQALLADQKLAWAIPISLGDSHRGYRVVGTTGDFFTHYRYGEQQPLTFAAGHALVHRFDAVLGAQVAKNLGYRLGDSIHLAHGIGQTQFSLHDERAFNIVGILKPTGTPIDHALYINLEGMEAIHLNWRDGVKLPSHNSSDTDINTRLLTPKTITAIFVGLQTKMATFQVQRQINDYRKEPLLAILPGIALTDLWQITRTMENTLQLIAALVLLSSLLGLSTLLLSSIRERQREIAVLRAIGARPSFVFWMIELEALLITLSGIALALIALVIATQSAQTVLAENYGLFITPFTLNPAALMVLGIIIVGALLLAAIPALSAYRVSLHAGLALKQ